MPDRSFARRTLPRAARLAALALGALGLAAACSSASGGPVTGPADAHCAGKPAQVTSQSACHGGAGGGSSSSSSSSSSASSSGSGAGGMDMADYGPTLNNAEGDDDDCKYHVKFTASDIAQNKDVTFTVVATNKTDGKPTTGAQTLAEVFLSDTHPAPNSGQKVTESPSGTYTVGPVRFDAPGKWTVRFHFFDACDDGETSPHAHIAFFVEVP